jgi:serine phosphatase RsbU (regulator of sigma subunit)
MVGSIAVGALRSMTGEDVTPSILLQQMNEIMVRNDERVFITCLCLGIATDGAVTIANAGHLSPYLNGQEMDCDSGLPLGLISGFPYSETTVTLPGEARITLMSDGVVEARSKDGELFGFDRTLAISNRNAGEIAAAAQQFGQQDDITVVTLDWSPLPVMAA